MLWISFLTSGFHKAAKQEQKLSFELQELARLS